MIYTYDIFDTIIYRKVPNPIDIFTVMEERLGKKWEKKKGSFSKIRKSVEFWLRRTSDKEICIEDIYERFRKQIGLTEHEVQELIEIELQIEKEYTVLNKKVLNEIKRHILNKEKVVLISDMYWHATQVRYWLSEKDEVFNKIPIYISCDYNSTKVKGNLYDIVRKKEHAKFSDWRHKGDNKRADYLVPKRMGIQCKLIKGGRKYAFEKDLDIKNINILETYGIITDSIALSNGNAFAFGASIAAPMVYQYVKWVLEQAINRGIENLYFVLRDGYILKHVADEIIKSKSLPIKTEYIFGSRVAWRFPSLTLESLRNLSVWEKSNWIFRDPAVAYVPFERLGFSKEEIITLFGERTGNRKLYSFADFKTLLNECLKNEKFINNLNSKILKSKELLGEYLNQTIDFSTKFAFVDTNSTGKTQKDLEKILEMLRPDFDGLKFFYHTFLADEAPDEQRQFVFIDSKESDRRFPEAFFRAPYNQCYGYLRKGERVVPRFHESDKCAWGYSFDYDSYLKGILEFTKRARDIKVDDYVNILLKVTNFDVISKDEIIQAAKLPFNPDMNGDEILDFYPRIHIDALLHPFSKLIYFPKGSYYLAGGVWIIIYKILNGLVAIKRMKGRK